MPRSPSRDLADRFDGNRAYFRRPDRTRYVLAAVALAAVGVWAAAEVVSPDRAAPSHTHGPLASPHAAWDADCAACHRPHSPSEIGFGSVFRAGDRWHDLTCDRCHAGPAHHPAVTGAGRAFHDRCSNCHHDHGGRTNSLVRIADSHCTSCHANLGANRANGSPRCEGRVTNFATDHPEFRPLTGTPHRTLKFSHAVHMTPGQAYSPGGREALTLPGLRALGGPDAAARYRRPGQSDSDLVSLDCASCHRLDAGGTDGLRAVLAAAGEPARAVLPPRPAGAHFLPVNFEAHCRACHPIRAPEGASAGKVIAGFDLPHRRPPAELDRELGVGYLRGLLAADHPALAAPVGPGGRLDLQPPDPARTLRGEADRLAAAARAVLFSDRAGCAKCHDVAGGAVAAVPDRTVWLPAARFDHTAHRATGCATCHPGTGAAFTPPGTAVVEKEPVQILGAESCRACHSPAGTPVTLPGGTTVTGGGVRHGCTDCHTYHDAGHGLRGRGADARFPARPLGLSEFLRPKGD